MLNTLNNAFTLIFDFSNFATTPGLRVYNAILDANGVFVRYFSHHKYKEFLLSPFFFFLVARLNSRHPNPSRWTKL